MASELRNGWKPDRITLHLRFERMEGAMKIERKKVIAAIGGPDAVMAMDDEARAEALENYLAKELDAQWISKWISKWTPKPALPP